MGRSRKNGLDYFPFDVDLFQDIRIRKLIKYQSGKAITVYALLLCIIYKDGYYMRWDKELPFIISEQTGFEEAYILEVINSCLKLGLFSNELYESDGILTSKGIQERYQKICDLCRRNCDILEYNVISSEEKHISSEEKPINSAKSTQRKEKKSKVNKEDIPNGIQKKDKLSSTSTSEKVDYNELMLYYNNTFKDKLPQIKSMTDTRKRAVKARISQYGKEAIYTVLDLVLQSSFLLGCNNRNWKCDFDWIFKQEHFTKILEGNYNGAKQTTTNIYEQKRIDSERRKSRLMAEFAEADAKFLADQEAKRKATQAAGEIPNTFTDGG